MNLLKYTKVYIIVAVLILLFNVAMLVTKGLNYGVDFTGGTTIRFPLSEPVTSPEVVAALETPELEELDLQLAPPQPYAYVDATGRQRYGVQVQTKFLNPEEQDMVIAALETAFGTAGEETALEVYGVDSLISQEMLSKSLLALLIAGALILGYMAFRFEFKSGVAGLFALVFDVMSVIGLFALLQKQVNVTFIAALLTIIGYSINNSIVVFDRIRENLRFRKKDESLVEVVNFSILQTMRRSVNTSATTVITIFLLYLIGSASIRDFCLAMIAGFTVGTFTSLFVAGPLWAIWKDSEERKKGRPAPAGAR